MSRTARTLLIATILAGIVAIGGCDKSPGGRDGAEHARSDHLDGEGPLASSGRVGGQSALTKPEDYRGERSGTFGMYLLCSTDLDREIELQKVRIEAGLAPDFFSPTLRLVTPADFSRTPQDSRIDFMPVGFVLGTPPRFDEPYGDEFRLAGEYVHRLDGQRIETDCEQVPNVLTSIASGREIKVPLVELLVTLSAGQSGAAINAVEIDYLADGEPYTLTLDWRLILCGDSPSLRDACR